MAPAQSSSLQIPTLFHGTYAEVQQKTGREGLRCGEQYRQKGSFPVPQQMLAVTSGEVVLTHGVSDLQHERPYWRLYMVSEVMGSLSEALEGQDTFSARDAYEAFFRETAWGALYFLLSPDAPRSAALTALRIRAVLRFWEPLQSARYLFKTLGATLTLDALVGAACDWMMDAWCPLGDPAVRVRLERSAEHMARATRNDCMEAISRQMPRALSFARGLKHQGVVGDPVFQRERLAALDAPAFERVSGACTSDLLALVYAWDRQLGKQ
jgi:hypothetical protein